MKLNRTLSHRFEDIGKPGSGGGSPFSGKGSNPFAGMPPELAKAVLGAVFGPGSKMPGLPNVSVHVMDAAGIFGAADKLSDDKLLEEIISEGNKLAVEYEAKHGRDSSKKFPVFKPQTRVYRVRRGKLDLLMATFKKIGGDATCYINAHHDHGVMYSIMADPEMISNKSSDVFLFEVVWQVGDLCGVHEELIKLIRTFAETGE